MSDRSRLDEAGISAGLETVPGWRREGDAIRRDYEFGDFDEAMAFINRVADVARALDHHPDLSNVYSRVGLTVSTHDAGGLTALDFEFARRVDALGP